MRWKGWWAIPVGATAIAVACSGLVDPPPVISATTHDSSNDEPPPTDDGTKPIPDWPPKPIDLKTQPGWQLFGPQHGGPAEVFGVSPDRAGNIWVAGGYHGLFLLTPGATEFQRFTVADGLRDCSDGTSPNGCAVISVAGGPENTVFVGYRGVFGTKDERDPSWMLKSGDADKVVWKGGGVIEIAARYDISSAPGYYKDPWDQDLRREKVRSVLRILYDAKTENIWFGGNHGVSMYEASSNQIFEHQHAGVNGYVGTNYWLLTGDWFGIALDPKGDLWMGGGNRVGRLQYGTGTDRWWSPLSPIYDVWPDAVAVDAQQSERTDDLVSDLIVDPGGSVWVGSLNGLARVFPPTPAPPPSADGGTGNPDAGTGNPDAGTRADAGTAPVPSGPWHGCWMYFNEYRPQDRQPGNCSYVRAPQRIDMKVTALERDPADGSIWVGHLWGGITRIKNGGFINYGAAGTTFQGFGGTVIDHPILDIQSDTFRGQRRILVAFKGGAVGIYTGP